MSNCKDISLKFMLDTTAYNKLYDNPLYFELSIKSLGYGFSYYNTEPQTWELKGFGAKVYDENCNPVYYNHNISLPNFEIIDEKLKIKYVSCGVNLMRYHTVLDGSAHSIDFNTKEGKMFEEILEYNSKLRKKRPFAQHYDAFIAEAAIHNNCILVTDDGALLEFVNRHFCDRAITTEMLIDVIKKNIDEVNHE